MATNPSWFHRIPSLSDDPTHPGQITLRTYALSLSLSLGPSLIPFVTALLTGRKSPRTDLSALKGILRRELSYNGFAFAITLSVGGGAALHYLWNNLDARGLTHPDSLELSTSDSSLEEEGRGKDKEIERNRTGVRSGFAQVWESLIRTVKGQLEGVELNTEQRTFLANVIASSVGIMLLQEGRERASRMKPEHSVPTSPTLDLTLLLVVRALDSIVQTFIHGHTNSKDHKARRSHLAAEPILVKDLLEKERQKRRRAFGEKLSMKVDALLFWACSTRIMWCFFYESQRLPRSYVKWIRTLANIDPRLLKTLNLLREGKWFYGNCSPAYVDFLKSYASDLCRPASWGNPTVVPSRGGPSADSVWNMLDVTSRPGVGGIPCEFVHGEVGQSLGLSHSCLANTGLRGIKAFIEAVAIYTPAHFVPILMTRPQTLLRPHRFLQTLVGALRSAAFLATFVASYYFAVCFTRTLVLAKYLPFISHNFWDGPFGCIFAGSLVCGSSIWIENGKRRGEMALYVMPKALRACLPDCWLKAGKRARIAERMVIILSTSSLLTAAVHRPESLRGLSRWTLSFIMNGHNAGFWKRKRSDPSIPPTPSIRPTLVDQSGDLTPMMGLSRSHTPNFTNHSHNRTSRTSPF